MSAKRKSVLLSEKIKIIARSKNGESLHSLAENTGYQRYQIRNWIRKEKQIISCNKQRQSKRVSGGGRKIMYPVIEEEILKWFRSQRSKKLIVNYSTLRREALSIAKVNIFKL